MRSLRHYIRSLGQRFEWTVLGSLSQDVLLRLLLHLLVMLEVAHGILLLSEVPVMPLFHLVLLLVSVGNLDLVNVISHGNFFFVLGFFGKSGLLITLAVHGLQLVLVLLPLLVLSLISFAQLFHLLLYHLAIFFIFVVLQTSLHVELFLQHVSAPFLVSYFIVFLCFLLELMQL